MKWLFYISLIFCFGSSSGQNYYTNAPEVVNPIIESFKIEAKIRGIEVDSKLSTLDSIIIADTGDMAGADYYRGTIRLRRRDMGNEFQITQRIYHELGHHFGLKHCFKCRYNIMSANRSDRAAFLFQDTWLRTLYFDMFFDHLKEPDKEHRHY